MIAVVDYGRGNLFSIGQALKKLGLDYEITANADRISAADLVLLPGVGAFGDAVNSLRDLNLFTLLEELAQQGKPLVGICLGMQLLASRSEEFGQHQGLGLIPGVVRQLPEGTGRDAVRIPNMGWRRLERRGGGSLWDGVPDGTYGYFIHSFALDAESPDDVVATITVNGRAVTAIVRRGNVTGFQFHPEKSGPAGLRLLANALNL